MSDFVDPFASAPADEAQAAPAPAPAPAESVFDAPPAEAPAPATPPPAKKAPAKKAPATVVQQGTDGGVSLTFKGGTGFDSPWIVIHATDLDDALEQVSGANSVTLAAVMERVQIAGQHFAKLGGGSGGSGGGRPQRDAAPAPAQQPPTGAPASPGEGWVYKTGVTKSGPKAGQTWQAWMPPDAAKAAGAKPVWF